MIVEWEYALSFWNGNRVDIVFLSFSLYSRLVAQLRLDKRVAKMLELSFS